ncbi:hypothetical protein MICRO11B_370011 [Micrococcus luteus]|nr:hypothetical protein MICRO11B_370011 [Micrococcus luteus]
MLDAELGGRGKSPENVRQCLPR